MYECFLYIYVYASHAPWYPAEVEESLRSLRIRVIYGNKVPCGLLRMECRSSERISSFLNHEPSLELQWKSFILFKVLYFSGLFANSVLVFNMFRLKKQIVTRWHKQESHKSPKLKAMIYAKRTFRVKERKITHTHKHTYKYIEIGNFTCYLYIIKMHYNMDG